LAADTREASGALRDVARPALAKGAMLFCDAAAITGMPCADCMRMVANVLHAVISELPRERVLPEEIDRAMRIHSLDA